MIHNLKKLLLLIRIRMQTTTIIRMINSKLIILIIKITAVRILLCISKEHIINHLITHIPILTVKPVVWKTTHKIRKLKTMFNLRKIFHKNYYRMKSHNRFRLIKINSISHIIMVFINKNHIKQSNITTIQMAKENINTDKRGLIKTWIMATTTPIKILEDSKSTNHITKK